jgi:hypothetical protein
MASEPQSWWASVPSLLTVSEATGVLSKLAYRPLGPGRAGPPDPAESGLDQVDGGQVLPGNAQLDLGGPVGGEQVVGRGGGDDPPPRQAAGGPVELAEFAAGNHVGSDHRAEGGRELGQDLRDQPRVADQGAVGPLLAAAQGGERPGRGGRVADGGLGGGELRGEPVGGRGRGRL